jgi:hypothetical protein
VARDDATLTVPPTRIVPVHGTRGNTAPPGRRARLGDALVDAGVITRAQLDACLAAQSQTAPRRRLGALVVERGLATDDDVAAGLGAILGFDVVDPATFDVPLDAVRRLPRSTAEALGAVPIAAGPAWVRVAVADPTDRRTVDALRAATGVVNVSLAVATPRSIEAALARFWSPGYVPPAAPAARAPEPEPDREPPARPPANGGWEYAFVGPSADLAATERELARRGRDGWEAVGLHSTPDGLTVLLKRRT